MRRVAMMTLAVSTGTGALLGGMHQYQDIHRWHQLEGQLVETNEELTHNQREQLEVRQHFAAVDSTLGDCRERYYRYLPPKIGNTAISEDDAVMDISLAPNQACGKPYEIRGTYHLLLGYFSNSDTLEIEEQSLLEYQGEIKRRLPNAEQQADSFQEVPIDTVTGLAVGLGFSALAASSRRKQRRKPNTTKNYS